MNKPKEFRVNQSNDGDWEVRDRADVFVAAFASKKEAQEDAKRRNQQ